MTSMNHALIQNPANTESTKIDLSNIQDLEVILSLAVASPIEVQNMKAVVVAAEVAVVHHTEIECHVAGHGHIPGLVIPGREE